MVDDHARMAVGDAGTRLDWFDDAGLGLFVHWGLSSVDARGELSWHMMDRGGDHVTPAAYFEQADRFDPDAWDPDRWLSKANRAGMEYAVLTAKHHDGFTLWPSNYGGFGTPEYCDGRDFVGEFIAACRRQGIHPGLYFSLTDWHHPSWPAEARETYEGLQSHTADDRPPADPDELARLEAYTSTTAAQLRELLTEYGTLDLLWFDTPGYFWGGAQAGRIGDLYALARSHQPGIVINGRGGATRWGDYGTPENELPETPPPGRWELCQTWADHWGYVEGDAYRDLDWTLERIARTVGRGGNLLLNIGPTARGSVPDQALERLDTLANWMAHSGAAVHRVEGGPSPPRSEVPITRRGDVWYLHVLPDSPRSITIDAVPAPVSVGHLRTGEPAAFDHADRRLSVTVPEADRESPDEVIAVTWPAGVDPA